jgi:hypothetical protein
VNTLAGHDKRRGARRFGIAVVKSEGGDDQDQQRNDRDQIDLARVVTVMTVIFKTSTSKTSTSKTFISVADFPAH